MEKLSLNLIATSHTQIAFDFISVTWPLSQIKKVRKRYHYKFKFGARNHSEVVLCAGVIAVANGMYQCLSLVTSLVQEKVNSEKKFP